MTASAVRSSTCVIDVGGLDHLIRVLRDDGWAVLGPVIRDGAVVPGPVRSTADLPRGVGDEQRPGSYRLAERGGEAFFGFASPATSFKPVLFPSRQLLWRGTRRDGEDAFDIERDDESPPRRALLGVRSCDLAALAVHDRVLAQRWGGRPAVDVDYVAGREATFVVAVTCGTPAQTCFCTSMGTGPDPGAGYDLALTEVVDAAGHRFVVRVGTERGDDVLSRIEQRPAEPADDEAAAAVLKRAVEAIGRQLDTSGLPGLLDAEVEHPLWEEVAQRCLACGNCTAVCPTCFCTSVDDVSDLTGQHAERWRVWDSCFTAGFSYVHGGPVRSSTASRYRQWMTHKLGTWQAQFDTTGCVGCGRCLTWCPVGIDITAEAADLRRTARASTSTKERTR
jgi:sulfhydrogenase subunit beta (sulfur reductase)